MKMDPAWIEIERLFDESLTTKVGYSKSALESMHRDIHFGETTGFMGPDPEMIGRVENWAIGYLRNSKGLYLETTSLIRQAEAIVALAKRLQLKIIGFYGDADTPGYDLHLRGGLMRATIKLQNGPAGILVVDEANRIARDGALGYVHSMLAKQRISIIDVQSGRVMDRTAVAINGLQAANEVDNLKHRTGSGKVINIRHRNKITKRTVYGHYRPFRGGPIKKDRLKCEVIVEIHELYDSGLKQVHIIEYLNQKWDEGHKKYRPPGKSKFWRLSHLDSSAALDRGILRYRDYVGEFWHLRTKNRPKNSRLKRQEIRSRDDWECVTDLKLLVVDRHLFMRNLERLDRERELNASKQDQHKLLKRYGQNGSGRRILTGVVLCGACNAHKFHYQRGDAGADDIRMKCGGTKDKNCRSWFSLDAPRLECIVIDALENEISSGGALEIYQKKIEAQHRTAHASLASSKAEIEAEVDGFGNELKHLLKEMSGSTGRSRMEYETRVKEVKKEIERAEKKLEVAATSDHAELLRGVDLTRCRSLVERLRDPQIYWSKRADDLFILERVISMIGVKIVPHDYDHGVTAHVSINLGKFFDSPIVQAELTRVFTVEISPRETGFRTPPLLTIDQTVFCNPERHSLDDATWAAMSDLLRPHWDKKKRFFGSRHLYDGIIRSLKAGAGPCTTLDRAVSCKRVSVTHYNILRHGLWPAVLAILRDHGQAWVDDLAPGILKHLQGIGGERSAPWKISRIKSSGARKHLDLLDRAA
jgi:DNA invertase Pin-like site-specific DNA recombinase